MGQVQEEQRKGLLRRPVDLALITYLIFAGLFTLFRGLVSLHWPCATTASLPAPDLPLGSLYLVQKGHSSSV